MRVLRTHGGEPVIFHHNRFLMQLFLLSAGHWPYITKGWIY